MLAMSRALVAEGHEAVLVTGRHPDCPDEEHRDGVRILREYEQAEAGSSRVMRRVLEIAQACDADIIEGADYLGECAGLLDCNDRPPILIKAHASLPLKALRNAQILYPWQHLTVGIACWRARRQMRAERTCLEHADAVVAPTQQMLDLMCDERIRLPALRGVVPNPVDAAAVAGPDDEAAVPTLLLAGRISCLKGIEFLRPMLERVVARFPLVRLEIAGSDTYARWVGSAIAWLQRDLGALRSQVEFLGPLTPRQMDAAYRRAWVVILPSRFDNFPNVVLEAMARGRPVVASPVGGVAAMLDGTSNRVVDPRQSEFADAVMNFLANRDLRQKAGLEGYRKATTRYAPTTVAKAYVEFVQSKLLRNVQRGS